MGQKIRSSALMLVLAWGLQGGYCFAGDDDVAVLIGNRDYGTDIPPVEYALNDVEAMESYVRNQLGVPELNIVRIENASLADFYSVFGSKDDPYGQLANMVKQGKSKVFVFYSGHGMPDQRTSEAHLVPVNARPNLIRLTGYAVDTLYNNLRRVGAKSVTVVMDACFSGRTPNGQNILPSTSALGMKSVMPKASSDFVVVAAGQEDQIARWDTKAKKGLLTSYFLQGAAGLADSEEFGNEDGAVTLAEMKHFLDKEMTGEARRQYSYPQVAFTDGPQSTVIGRYDVNFHSRRRLEERATVREQELWAVARNSNTTSTLENYIREYPTGAFVKDAQRMLVLLRKNKELENRPGKTPKVNLPPF